MTGVASEQLQLTDGSGRGVSQKYIGVAQTVERQTLAVEQQPVSKVER